MHYILYVQLLDFYLNNLTAEARDSLSKPILIVRDKRVIGANEAAIHRKVAVDMDMEHARALAPSAETRPWKVEDYLQKQEAWLDICVQYSGVIEPEDQHAAYVDLSLHPAPDKIALQLIQELSKEYPGIRAGAAPSKWVAGLAASESRFSIDDPREFLSDLSIDRLVPVAPEHRQRLRFLGYRKIGDVADIPLATLKRQFGEDALPIRLAARGRLQDTVAAKYPKDSIFDSLMFDGLVESLEMLDEALVSFSKRLGRRLREKDLYGTDLHAQVEFEEKTKTFSRRFAKPIKCPISMLSALRLLFVGELTEPVVAIRIKIPKLERTRSTQTDLLGKSEKDKSIDAALQNLRVAFGDRAVQSAGEIKLPRRLLVLKEWKDALGWQ